MAKLTEQQIINIRANLEQDLRSRFRGVRAKAEDAMRLLNAGASREAVLAACEEVTSELEAYLDC